MNPSCHSRSSSGILKGRLRLGLLAAIAAAFLLVPAAQALANGTATVEIVGEGSGEVSSAGGFYESAKPTGQWEGNNAAIECSYTSPGPQTGTCGNELEEEPIEAAGFEAVSLHAIPAPGSKFVEWIVVEGIGFNTCEETQPTLAYNCTLVVETGTGNVKVLAVFEPATTLSLNLSTSGTGSGSFGCFYVGVGGYAEPCQTHYPEGTTELQIKPLLAEGSEFVEWTGDCSGTSEAGCTVTMDAAHSVNAVLNNPSITTEFPLSVTKSGTGTGTVTSTPAGINCGATCTAEFPENEVVTLTAAEDPGSEFVEWTGACTSSPCEVTMSAAKSVNAKFEPAPGNPLTVYVSGAGSVSAGSGTISGCTSAGGPSCTGTYEGTVTLTETPTSGYVFAGWVGCKHSGATTCEVTVNAEKEVYATFLKEGTEGSNGSNGKNIVVGTATAGECPTGGITVEIEGEPLSKQHICNGATGATGSNGTNGKNIVTTEITTAGLEGHCVGVGGVRVEVEGESSTRKYVCNGEKGLTGNTGSTGATGATGAQGAVGAAGSNGKDGAAGPQGPQGAQGPAGPAGKVTCKVKGSKKVKVTCTVKASASSSSARLRWKLMRAGHAYSHGVAQGGRLRLDLGNLRPGHYLLHVQGQKGGTRIVIG